MKSAKHKKKTKTRIRNLITVLVILAILIGVPYMVLHYQAGKSGMTIREVVQRKMVRSEEADSREPVSSGVTDGEKLDFLQPRPIGMDDQEKPMISHLAVDDFDNDGLLDVIVCDALDNFVSWIRQYPAGTYTETVLAKDLIAPAHVQVIDFDGDGDTDLFLGIRSIPGAYGVSPVQFILENDG